MLLPGSSGGPVLDAAGQLLGINTNRLGEGFYLAIPADRTLRRRAPGYDAGDRDDGVRARHFLFAPPVACQNSSRYHGTPAGPRRDSAGL